MVSEIEATILDLTVAGGPSVRLVEQYVGFAVAAADRFYVMEAGPGDLLWRGWRGGRDPRPGSDGDLMHLTPADTEKLLLAVAGMVARDRLTRGVRLNYPEAVALLSTWVIERARDGASVTELMETGREVLSRDQVMPGVAEMLSEVQVEATFPDGRKLVTIHHPIL